MTTRTDIIAAVLRRPVFRRPVVGHELRGPQVQLLGRNSDVTWTATIPQITEAIDTALLKSEEKDIPAATFAAGTASTARGEILAALQHAGYNEAAAAELLARAGREPHDPGTEFRETLAGGHALIVQYGDCELHGSCQCGKRLGLITPDKPLDGLGALWERHTMTEVS